MKRFRDFPNSVLNLALAKQSSAAQTSALYPAAKLVLLGFKQVLVQQASFGASRDLHGDLSFRTGGLLGPSREVRNIIINR